MIDAFFNAFAAFHQIGFLFGGLICLGLALLIVFAEIQTRQRCVRVQGRIVAVRRGGAVAGTTLPKDAVIGMMESASRYYYPVYEYTDRNGKVVRAHSSSGSNSLSDKIIGTSVPLLVNPDEPWEAHSRGFGIVAVIVFFLLIPATLCLYVAFFNFDFSIYSALFTGALLLYWTYKFIKTIKPRDQWEKPSEFKLRRREERRKRMETPSGHIMDEEEFRLRLAALDKYGMIWSPVTILISFALLTGGFYLERDMKDLSLHAERTQGEVVRMKEVSNGSDSSYYPVVAFTSASGNKIEFQSDTGSNPPSYKSGEKVDVMYDPANPKRAKVDRGIFNNLPAIACYVLGGLLLWWQLSFWSDVRRRRL